MRVHLLAATWFSLCAASLTHAQSIVPTPADPRPALFTGERVRIVDVNGTTTEGRFHGASSSGLRVAVRNALVEVPNARIQQVLRQRHEPDGVTLGLVIGAAAGAVYVALSCHGASEHDDCVNVGTIILVPPGAAIGALVDWQIRRFDVVFRRSAGPASRLRLGPIVARGHRGVALLMVAVVA